MITIAKMAYKIDAITLHPTMNLRDCQRMDPHLAYIIDLKSRKLQRMYDNVL